MKLTTPRLIIGDGEAFEQDVLDRRMFGEKLMNLISRSNDALVIALNAPWGEGKTTFVHMWQGLLKKNGIHNIYFDAFENDYVDDAFIAIVSRIVFFIEQELKDNLSFEEKLAKLKKQASKVGGQLMTWTAKLAVKAATIGIVKESDIEALQEIKTDLAKGTTELVSKFVENRIASHEQNVQSIESFKETLTSIAETIQNNTGKPLVVIIDELDRCKPTYAVEIVEKIKHLFSVENIMFILVMNKPQLEEAVRSVYGQGIDANVYLQKFINVECTLPKDLTISTTNDYLRYCNRLYDLHELETWGDKSELVDVMIVLSQHLQLSLRELEKCFTYISIFYGSVKQRSVRIKPIIAMLAVIKIRFPELYLRLGRKDVTANEVVKVVKLPEEDSDENEAHLLWYIASWAKYCLSTDEEFKANNVLKEFGYGRYLAGNTLSRKQVISYHLEHMDLVIVR